MAVQAAENMDPGAWLPYCGSAPLPSELALRWNLDPVILAALAVAAVACFTLHEKRRGLALAAVAVLAISFVTPLCALASALFSARVAHHAALVAVAAPLLAFGLAASARPWPGLPLATAVHAVAFWVWHAPGPYAAALSNDAVYWLMQATLFGSALVFWRAVRSAGGMAAAGALLATMMQMGLLGALITFSAEPLYAPHLGSTAAWGLSPLADQQLAGLIMWAPMAGVYLLAALVLVGRSLRADDAVARA
jgi:putative membrane protein